jgi:hypothetical protein
MADVVVGFGVVPEERIRYVLFNADANHVRLIGKDPEIELRDAQEGRVSRHENLFGRHSAAAGFHRGKRAADGWLSRRVLKDLTAVSVHGRRQPMQVAQRMEASLALGADGADAGEGQRDGMR